MVIGNAQDLQFSIAGTGDAIPSIIAKALPETTPADVVKRSALITLGLLLLVITLLTNVTARVLIGWLSRPRVSTKAPKNRNLSSAGPMTADPVQLSAARSRSKWVDRIMTIVLGGCQLCTVVPLFLILGYISYKGASGVNWAFFTELPNGGLGHALLGSAILVALASVLAVPMGIFAAVLLAEYKNNRFVAELLGGVPSIIVGVFAYSVLVYPMWESQPWGYSAWAGAFALAVLMLPVVIRASEEAMRLVPSGLREASYALGASQWQTVVRVIIPAALPAIITGVLLAVGRVAGETAPLLFTAYNSSYWPKSLNEPTPFLPYFILNFSKYPEESDEIRLAWAAAFVLLVLIIVLNAATRLASGKRVVDASAAG
jgi:phosphate transport system permease protein